MRLHLFVNGEARMPDERLAESAWCVLSDRSHVDSQLADRSPRVGGGAVITGPGQQSLMTPSDLRPAG